MVLALAATRTAPDTYRFDVTGVDIAAAPTFVINFGDSSAPLTVTTDVDGTTTVTHTYTDPGHHTYTATVTAAQTPYAATLAELAAKGQPDQSLFAAVAAPGGAGSAGAIDLGHQFRPTVAGVMRGVRYVRSTTTGQPNPRSFYLWDVPTQTKLATGQSTGETGTGWREGRFTPPPPVLAGRDYAVSYQSAYTVATTPIPAAAPIQVTAGVAVYTSTPGQYPAAASSTYFYYTDILFAAYGGTLADIAANPSLSTLADIPRTQATATATVTVDVGPATIWASVVEGDPIPAVQVDVWIGNPETVIGWRVERDQPADSTPIWVGDSTSGAMSLVDHTAPLGVPITYRLTVTYANFTTTTVAAAPVTLAGTAGCYLTNPATGATLRVELVSWPTRRRAGRRALLDVLGRADPVALSDVHSTPEGVWTFITRTDAATAAITAMLANVTGVVVYRAQPGSSIASCTASVGDVEERRYSGTAGDQRRLMVAEIQEIAPLPATALPLRATLGGLATYDGDTLGELSQLRPTLLQLSMIATG